MKPGFAVLLGAALVASAAVPQTAAAQKKSRAAVMAAKKAEEARSRQQSAPAVAQADSVEQDASDADRPRRNVHLDAGRVFLAKGRLDEARGALDEASAFPGNTTEAAQLIVEVRVNLAQELAKGNRWDDAFAVLDDAALDVAGRNDLAPLGATVLEARLGFIRDFAKRGKYADAFRELAAATPAGSPPSAREAVETARLEIAEALAADIVKVAAAGKHADALKQIDATVSEMEITQSVREVLNRTHSEVLESLAGSTRVLAAKGRHTQALAALDAVLALENQPKETADTVVKARIELAQSLAGSGRQTQALAVLDSVLVVNGASKETAETVANARVEIGRSFAAAGQFPQALSALDAAAKTEGISAELVESVGFARVDVLKTLAGRRPDEGLKQLEDAAAVESSEKVSEAIALARVSVAKDMAEKGRQPVALVALDKAAAVESNSEKAALEIASARLDVARTYAARKRHADALKVLDAAAALHNPPAVADRIALDRLEYLLTQARPASADARELVVAMLRKEPEGVVFAAAVEPVQELVENVRAEQALVVLDEPGALRPDRPVRLRARVIDPKDEVSTLELRYRGEGTRQWNVEPMRKTTGDWNGFIRRPDALAPADRTDDYQVEFLIAALNANGGMVDSYGTEARPALLDISTARWEEAEAVKRANQPVVTELPAATLPVVELAPAKPWYSRWYTWAGAGAVVAGAAVVTAVVLSQPPELPSHDKRIVLP